MFDIKIVLKETKGDKNKNMNVNFYDLDEDYDSDCILLDICEALNITKAVDFVISGFGEEKWNVNCRADLPCFLEHMKEILEGVKYKQDFIVDLYEQGMEREIKFVFINEQVMLFCESYVGNLPPEKFTSMSYDNLKKMFYTFFDDFINCIVAFSPEYLHNHIFIEWMNMCNELRK